MSSIDDTLDNKYNVLRLGVLSSHQVSSRTAAVIKHLSENESDNDKKPAICCLHAQARVANKLITIVEIAKRELASFKIGLHQYNVLSSEVITLKKQPTVRSEKEENGGDGDGADQSEDGEPDAFQTMEEKEKIRAVPVLTIYLSSAAVKELKQAHG